MKNWAPRAPRFALHVPVRIRQVGAEHWECGHTVNISRSGLLLVISGCLRCDDLVEAIVRLSHATSDVADVWLLGRVARLNQRHADLQLATTIGEYRFDSGHAFVVTPTGN